jgi:hypothetical protein
MVDMLRFGRVHRCSEAMYRSGRAAIVILIFSELLASGYA